MFENLCFDLKGKSGENKTQNLKKNKISPLLL